MKKYSLLLIGLVSFVVIEQSTNVLAASYESSKSVQDVKEKIQAFIHMNASLNPAGMIVSAIATDYTIQTDWNNYIYPALTQLNASLALKRKVEALWKTTINLQQ